VSKETYYKAKETYSYGKRDLLGLTFLRDAQVAKETYAHGK
jgi:hypothetical protein